MEKLKKNIDKLNQIFLFAVLIVFFITIFSQIFFPEVVANNSTWAYADGWQREVGILNIGLTILIIYTLKVKDEKFINVLTIALTVVVSLFGINQLSGIIIYQDLKLINIIFTILNFIAAFAGIVIIAIRNIK